MNRPEDTDPVADLPLVPGSVPGCHPWLLFAELARQQFTFALDVQRLFWRSTSELATDVIQPMTDLERRTADLLLEQQQTAAGLLPVIDPIGTGTAVVQALTQPPDDAPAAVQATAPAAAGAVKAGLSASPSKGPRAAVRRAAGPTRQRGQTARSGGPA